MDRGAALKPDGITTAGVSAPVGAALMPHSPNQFFTRSTHVSVYNKFYSTSISLAQYVDFQQILMTKQRVQRRLNYDTTSPFVIKWFVFYLNQLDITEYFE